MKTLPHAPTRSTAADGFFDPLRTNGMRSESARLALESYQSQTGIEDDLALSSRDLITDLLHYLHSRGEDPIQHVKKAVECFELEAGSLCQKATDK